MNYINHKGYIGQFNVDTETGLIRGTVINTRDVITFHGSTVQDAKQSFCDSVDDYLEFCASLGESPEKPYSGKLLLRLQPKLHRELHILAGLHGESINKLITNYLTSLVRKGSMPLEGERVSRRSGFQVSVKESKASKSPSKNKTKRLPV